MANNEKKKRQLQNSLVLAFKLNSLLTDQIGKLSLHISVANLSLRILLVEEIRGFQVRLGV